MYDMFSPNIQYTGIWTQVNQQTHVHCMAEVTKWKVQATYMYQWISMIHVFYSSCHCQTGHLSYTVPVFTHSSWWQLREVNLFIYSHHSMHICLIITYIFFSIKKTQPITKCWWIIPSGEMFNAFKYLISTLYNIHLYILRIIFAFFIHL